MAVVATMLCFVVVGSANAQQITRPNHDPSTWTADIKSQYEAIHLLPGMPKEPVIAAVKKIAKSGVAAWPALADLAGDTTLPEPHRAMSGIMSTFFIRYDANALHAAAEDGKNPFAQRQSIDFLTDIGGPQVKDYLVNLGKNNPLLTAYIGKILPKVPEDEAISEDSRRMLSNLLLQPVKGKLSAAVSIGALYEGKSTMDSWLESLTLSPVSDDETQMYAAMALVKIHAKSVPELAALCARKKHRFIRYNAILELSQKGPSGELVLRELLAVPDEPLRSHIEAKLPKK